MFNAIQNENENIIANELKGRCSLLKFSHLENAPYNFHLTATVLTQAFLFLAQVTLAVPLFMQVFNDNWVGPEYIEMKDLNLPQMLLLN